MVFRSFVSVGFLLLGVTCITVSFVTAADTESTSDITNTNQQLTRPKIQALATKVKALADTTNISGTGVPFTTTTSPPTCSCQTTTASPTTSTDLNPTTGPAPTNEPVTTTSSTQAPTEVPTQTPTETPTQLSTQPPTESPTQLPTQVPIERPTETPTEPPTEKPTEPPTETPTTVTPTTSTPTTVSPITAAPTVATMQPTTSPTVSTIAPTTNPTTTAPTTNPTTTAPTVRPTTAAPTFPPTTPPPICPPDSYPTTSPQTPTLPPINTTPYRQTSYLTSPLTTFAEHLDILTLTQPILYATWMNQARSRYQQNGYYIDTSKITPGSYPFPSPNKCYSCKYYENGYSKYGYDQLGYDPYGYNEAGYARDGYSRTGRDTGDQYNVLCQFQNPNYAGQRCIMNGNGRPLTSSDGTILRYDTDGYDQYGNDAYGNPRPKPCNGTTTPPPPPPSTIPITTTGVECETKSEEKRADGSILYIRKSTAAMTADDWSRFKKAWNTLNDQGIIRQFEVTHASPWGHHRTTRFLPWHREYVARLEDRLHRVDKCVFLPYWDVVANPAFPAGIAADATWPPGVKTVAADGVTVSSTAAVTRGIGGPLPNAAIVATALAPATFPTFTTRLEGVHDSVHVYVGGSMGIVPTASRDPIFFMHHANIDRLWAEWQTTHATEPTAAVIAGMAPIRFAAGDTKTYAQLSDTLKVVTTRGSGVKYI